MARALIIGGSLGGLFAGLLLRQAGWDVTVFERSSGDLASRGVGIGTHVELFAVMRRLGIAVDESFGVPVTLAHLPRSRRRGDRAAAVRENPELMGAVLPRAQAASAGRLLSAGHGARRYRAKCRRRHRGLRRWRESGGRPPGRRRWAAFHRAGARFRRPRAALCRLCGLARGDRGAGDSTGRARAARVLCLLPDAARDGALLFAAGRR